MGKAMGWCPCWGLDSINNYQLPVWLTSPLNTSFFAEKILTFFFFFVQQQKKKNVPVLSLQPLLCQNKQGVSFTWANYFNPFAYRVIRIYLVIYQCFFSFIYFVLSTFEFYTAQTSVNISRSHYTLWINNALFTLQCDRFIFLFNVHCGEPWILQHHRYLERYVLH